jgi:hypothetical protein
MVNKLLLTFFIFFYFLKAYCQISIYDDIQAVNDLRNKQLLNDSFKSSSFLIRSTSDLHNYDYKNGKNIIKRILFSYLSINNNNLPIIYNGGNLYPSRGLQERFSFGVNLVYKNIDINLQPEFIFAENIKQIEFKGNELDGNWWPRYYLMVANNVDDFRQFGIDKIEKSSGDIRLERHFYTSNKGEEHGNSRRLI